MPNYTHLLYHPNSESYVACDKKQAAEMMTGEDLDDVTDVTTHVLRAALRGEWTGGKILPKDICAKGTEHGEQAALMAWANAISRNGLAPALRRLWATPNGGERSIEAACQAKAEGVKKGVPDLFLAHMKQFNSIIYGGLFIEMKRKNGTMADLSPEQVTMIADLKEAGYACVVCFGWIHARDILLEYLEIDLDSPKVYPA